MPTETGTLDWLIAQLYNLRKTLPGETPIQVYDPGDGFNHGTPDGIEKMFKDDTGDLWKTEQDAQDNVDQIPVDADDEEVPVVGELKTVVAIRLFA